jgi:hypothetical protein
MSLYTQSQVSGKLWLRNILGNIESGSNVLSSIYQKYSSQTEFYQQLIENQIKKFDVFYDCIFVETDSGYFFEKIDVDEEMSLLPYTKYFFFNPKKTTAVDYWLDEFEQKIIFCDIQFITIANSTLVFDLYLNDFDLNTGITRLKLHERFDFKILNNSNWSNFTPEFETPKITFNPDTKNYNVSFVFRGKQKEFALMSVMIRKVNKFTVFKVDGIVPFINLDLENSNHFSLI